MTLFSLARGLVPGPLRMPVKSHLYPLVPLQWRMGRAYWQLKAFLQEAQWWELGRIEHWQLERLREIVRYAYGNVPGYHLLYRDAGIKPDDLVSLDDIKWFPLTTRELLQDNLQDFTAKGIPSWRRRYVTTGGSTGIPFGFYRTVTSEWMEAAFMHSGWERVGWRLGDTLATLRGEYFGSEQRFWKYDSANRELHLSIYHITERTYREYMRKLENFRPKHLHGYPSAVTMLADLIRERQEVGRINIGAILLGSENIYDWQKEIMRNAFPNTRIFGWYGLTEQAVLAHWCEVEDRCHVWPFYGLTEILDGNKQQVSTGKVGEIVGTSFWNRATPFIRYRTEDLARYGGIGCVHCGRQFMLLGEIVGRTHGQLVSESGRNIPLVVSYYIKHFVNVRQFQFYQEVPGKVTLRIVRKSSYTKQDTRNISQEFRARLGDELQFTIEFVDDIPRTPRGKHQLLEQKLEITSGE